MNIFETDQLREIAFARQPSDMQRFCTAYSLTHAVQLTGRIVNGSHLEVLTEIIRKQNRPLIQEERVAFLRSFRLASESFPITEDVEREAQLLGSVVAFLTDGPANLSISTFLSKRDKQLRAAEHFSEHASAGDAIIHRVTAVLTGESIAVIDPYLPQNPEFFQIYDVRDHHRLFAWIMSVYIQKYHPGFTGSENSFVSKASEFLSGSSSKIILSEGIREARIQGIRETPFIHQSDPGV